MGDRESEASEERSYSEAEEDWDEEDFEEEEFDEDDFEEVELEAGENQSGSDGESSHRLSEEDWEDQEDRGSSFYDSSHGVSRSETHSVPDGDDNRSHDEEDYDVEDDYSQGSRSRASSRDSRSYSSRRSPRSQRSRSSRGSRDDSRSSRSYGEEQSYTESRASGSYRSDTFHSEEPSIVDSRGGGSTTRNSQHGGQRSVTDSRDSTILSSHASQSRGEDRSFAEESRGTSRSGTSRQSKSSRSRRSYDEERSYDSRGSRSSRSRGSRSSRSPRSYEEDQSFADSRDRSHQSSSRRSESMGSNDDGTRSFAESQSSQGSVRFSDDRDKTEKFNNSKTDGLKSPDSSRSGSSRRSDRSHSSRRPISSRSGGSSRRSGHSRSSRSRSSRSSGRRSAVSGSDALHSTIENSTSLNGALVEESIAGEDESAIEEIIDEEIIDEESTFNEESTIEEHIVAETETYQDVDEETVDDDSTYIHERIGETIIPSADNESSFRPPQEEIPSDDDSTFVDESVLDDDNSNAESHANSTIATTTLKSPGALIHQSTRTLKTSSRKKMTPTKEEFKNSLDTLVDENMQRPSFRFEHESFIKKPDSKLDLGLKTPKRTKSMGSGGDVFDKQPTQKDVSPRRGKKKSAGPTADTSDSSNGKSSRQSNDVGLKTPQRRSSIAPDQHAHPDEVQNSPRRARRKGAMSPRPVEAKGKVSQTKTPDTHNQATAEQVSRPSAPTPSKPPQPLLHAPAPQPFEMQVEPIVKDQLCSSIAVLGTMSDAGKSIITAGLCRVMTNHGMRVAPFKGQNMSNNSSPALLPEGERRHRLYKAFKKAVGGDFPKSEEKPDSGYGEIGTAQSLQAEACKTIPRVEMNPVLLKSGGQNKKGEYLCSVLVLGKQVARETYGDLGKRTTDLRTMVLESHQALADVTDCDAIVMEGAGSCTELNLMERDIVNLPLVRALQCPWLLVANIDCGGVFAQIVGTKMCVSNRDWSLCAGIVVNKLRGEAKYFEPGPEMIEKMVGKPVFVVPFLRNLNLPEEDGMGIERRLAWEASGQIPPSLTKEKNDDQKRPVVVVVAYPHTAISDDLCPLEGDPRFEVQWRRRRIPRPYPHTTAVVLPGSRLTQKDLKWLHDSGWATFLRKHVAAGGSILGICGGYQMLGWSVEDPEGVEGAFGSKQGLGLLPIRTKIEPPEVKVVAPRKGSLYGSNIPIEGFELHCGQSEIITLLGDGLSTQIHPLILFEDGKPEGMGAGRAKGTYVHGILWSAEARVELLVPERKDFPVLKDIQVQDPLDRLAAHLESCGLDFKTLKGMLGKQYKNV